MDRTTNRRKIGPKVSLVITTALASALLAGCTTNSAPTAESSYSKSRSSQKAEKGVSRAESAVQSEPRDAAARAILGAAYLEAGRFEAAATSFKDALDLGDSDPRTTLSYALAATAIGDSVQAIAALEAREGSINAADYGLALALAGKPEKGIHVLINAVRSGQKSAKLRQNLAYTYALAGNWRAARVMAAEDVPADQLDKRLTEWAADAKPEDVMKRVAKLLGVTPAAGGQPAHLALANFQTKPTMVAQADAPAARELDDADLAAAPVEAAAPPVRVASARPTQSEALAFRVDSDVDGKVRVQTIDPSATENLRNIGTRTADVAVAAPVAGPRYVSNPVVQPLPGKPAATSTQMARAASYDEVVDPTVANILLATGAKTAQAAAPAPVAIAAKASPASATERFVSKPVVQTLPERPAPRRVAETSSQRRMAAPVTAPAPVAVRDNSAGSHLVQLGSYSSRAEAQNGWNVLQRKFPQLNDHDLVITKAKVNGKIFYRVAAAGFGPSSARSLCGTVKSSGRGCFAYAATNPPKGAIDNGVRIAARTN